MTYARLRERLRSVDGCRYTFVREDNTRHFLKCVGPLAGTNVRVSADSNGLYVSVCATQTRQSVTDGSSD